MIDVEPRELAVAHEIDAGALLRMDDDARRVDQRLLGRQGDEPLGHRIGADDGGQDAGLRSIHLVTYSPLRLPSPIVSRTPA
jgi:hypothetical protein